MLHASGFQAPLFSIIFIHKVPPVPGQKIKKLEASQGTEVEAGKDFPFCCKRASRLLSNSCSADECCEQIIVPTFKGTDNIRE